MCWASPNTCLKLLPFWRKLYQLISVNIGFLIRSLPQIVDFKILLCALMGIVYCTSIYHHHVAQYAKGRLWVKHFAKEVLFLFGWAAMAAGWKFCKSHRPYDCRDQELGPAQLNSMVWSLLGVGCCNVSTSLLPNWNMFVNPRTFFLLDEGASYLLHCNRRKVCFWFVIQILHNAPFFILVVHQARKATNHVEYDITTEFAAQWSS